MIDHISFSVHDFKKSCLFYDTTLAILGIERLMTLETDEINLAGYGLPGKIQEETKETIPGKPSFWIFKEPIPNPEEFVGKARGFHVAFPASSPEMIQAWYQKCLESGAQDNGAPGPRRYHPGYYAAFVVDPNGYRIEAVLHDYKDKTVSA